MYPTYNTIMPANKSTIKAAGLYNGSIPGNIGVAIATPNQNTEKFMQKSATVEIKAGSTFLLFRIPIA